MIDNAGPVDMQVAEVDGRRVIKLSGEIDLAGAPVLRDALIAVITQSDGVVVVDLAELDFIDSTGLSALIAGFKHARTLERRFHLAALKPRIARLFKITAVDKLIPIYPTTADAFAAPAPDVSATDGSDPV